MNTFIFKRYVFNFLLVFLFLISISGTCDAVFGYNIFCTDFENSTSFHCVPRGDLSISLDSNPTTGYTWNFTKDMGNAIFLNKTFYQTPSEVPIMGRGGVDLFIFKLDDFSLVKLSFNYARYWENSSCICKKEFIIFVY